MDDYPKLRQTDLKLQRFSPDNHTMKQEISQLDYDDIEEVAKLSQIYFPRSSEVSISYLKKTIDELYFNDGEKSSAISSLVSRSKEGNVDGFLGVTTTSFLYKGSKITAANCHHLMATEKAREQLIPMKMLQEFISGPQELSFSDGSVETMQLFWKRLGGEPSVSESIYYKVPLRPASFALRPFLKRLGKPLGKLAHASSSGMDTVAGALQVPLFHRKKPDIQLRPLTSELLLHALEKARSGYSLFPDYNQSKIEHRINLLAKEKRYGTFHKLAIMNGESIIGWFIYYSKKGSVCEVIQAVSLPGKETLLFDTLTWHAYSRGGVELAGRLMANHMKTPFTTKAICMPARMWTLLHSSNVDLKHDIQAGNAFITRLEGDLWLL